jgi:hypothetical protein
MILTQQDIDEFIQKFESYDYLEVSEEGTKELYGWIANNPQVLIV